MFTKDKAGLRVNVRQTKNCPGCGGTFWWYELQAHDESRDCWDTMMRAWHKQITEERLMVVGPLLNEAVEYAHFLAAVDRGEQDWHN